MRTRTIIVISVTGIIVVGIFVWYFKYIKTRQPFFGDLATGDAASDATGYSITKDSQESCDQTCFGSQYYDACMQSCLEGDNYIGEDFNYKYFGNEVSPYRYETPGK